MDEPFNPLKYMMDQAVAIHKAQQPKPAAKPQSVQPSTGGMPPRPSGMQLQSPGIPPANTLPQGAPVPGMVPSPQPMAPSSFGSMPQGAPSLRQQPIQPVAQPMSGPQAMPPQPGIAPIPQPAPQFDTGQQPMRGPMSMPQQGSQIDPSFGQNAGAYKQPAPFDFTPFMPKDALTPEMRTNAENAMGVMLKSINHGQSGGEKGARVGQWIFANVVAPLAAAHARTAGSAQGAMQLMQQSQQALQQDKAQRQSEQQQHLAAVAQLGQMLQHADKTQLASIAQAAKANQGNNQMQAAWLRAQSDALHKAHQSGSDDAQAELRTDRGNAVNARLPGQIEDTAAQIAQRGSAAKLSDARATDVTAQTKPKVEALTQLGNQRGAQAKKNLAGATTEGTKQDLNKARTTTEGSKQTNYAATTVQHKEQADLAGTRAAATATAKKGGVPVVTKNTTPPDGDHASNMYYNSILHFGANHSTTNKWRQHIIDTYGDKAPAMLKEAETEAAKGKKTPGGDA